MALGVISADYSLPDQRELITLVHKVMLALGFSTSTKVIGEKITNKYA